MCSMNVGKNMEETLKDELSKEDITKLLCDSANENNGCMRWNEWREKNNITEVNLSGIRLNGVYLDGANLKNADLSFADFSLSVCLLSEEEQELLEMGVDEIFIETNLNYADLRGANLHSANFNDAKLVGANLSDAIIMNTQFIRANLENATLVFNTFYLGDTEEIQLSGTYESINFRRQMIFGTNFSEANLIGTNLDGVWLKNVDFNRTRLSNLDFRNVIFENVNAVDAHLENANFQDVDLKGINLDGAILTNANLAGANLQAARLTNTRLQGATLTGAEIWEIQYDGWAIDGLVCDYIYTSRESYKNRVPNEGVFKPGQFEERFSSYYTFSYHFEHGFKPLDPLLVSYIIDQLNEANPTIELRVKRFETDSFSSYTDVQIIRNEEGLNEETIAQKTNQILDSGQKIFEDDKFDERIRSLYKEDLRAAHESLFERLSMNSQNKHVETREYIKESQNDIFDILHAAPTNEEDWSKPENYKRFLEFIDHQLKEAKPAWNNNKFCEQILVHAMNKYYEDKKIKYKSGKKKGQIKTIESNTLENWLSDGKPQIPRGAFLLFATLSFYKERYSYLGLTEKNYANYRYYKDKSSENSNM